MTSLHGKRGKQTWPNFIPRKLSCFCLRKYPPWSGAQAIRRHEGHQGIHDARWRVPACEPVANRIGICQPAAGSSGPFRGTRPGQGRGTAAGRPGGRGAGPVRTGTGGRSKLGRRPLGTGPRLLRARPVRPGTHRVRNRAADYAAGRQWRPFHYAETGIGNYRENTSSSTAIFGGAGNYDTFLPIRVGGGWNRTMTERHSFNGTLDYRFRWYDDSN